MAGEAGGNGGAVLSRWQSAEKCCGRARGQRRRPLCPDDPSAEICVAGVSETSRSCRAMLVSPGMESRGCSGGA